MSIIAKGLGESLRVTPKKHVGIAAPDWAVVPHKGMKTLPTAEFKEKLESLARDRLNATTDAQHANIGRQVAKLAAQYVSDISPDRKTMFAEGMEMIKKSGGKKAPQEPTPDKTLIDFLNEHDEYIKKGMKNDKPYPLKSGGSVTAIHNSYGGYNYEIKAGTETVLSIDTVRGNCSYTLTRAEVEKSKSFYKLLDAATGRAKFNKEFHPPKAGLLIDSKA